MTINALKTGYKAYIVPIKQTSFKGSTVNPQTPAEKIQSNLERLAYDAQTLKDYDIAREAKDVRELIGNIIRQEGKKSSEKLGNEILTAKVLGRDFS